MVTGRAIEVEKVCAGGDQPGMMRRHLSVVSAAARVCGAQTEGATIGSTRLHFSPGPIQCGDHHFFVGTGSSAVPLLQTLVPALMVAGGPSTLTVEGSTHASGAPAFDHILKTWAPALSTMGPEVKVELHRHGFFPAGGGKITAAINPGEGRTLEPLRLTERGEVSSKRATALVAHLDGKIAQRELETLEGLMSWAPEELCAEVVKDADGPGNAVLIEVVSEKITEVFSGVGSRHIRAEAVAEQAAAAALEYITAEVPVARHTAEGLIIPLAMAGKGSFCTTDLSPHTQSAIDLVHLFTDVEVAVANIRGQWHVEV
jgi:RNA 3'-terminal phosphate cyclase (ATP)